MDGYELEYVLRFNFAASYLDFFRAQGVRAGLLKIAYQTEDLREWAKERIDDLLTKCADLKGKRDLSMAAQGAVRDSRAALADMGFSASTLGGQR